MTALEVALLISVALVSTTLKGSFGLREWSWRHQPARLPIVADGVFTVVIIAGALWGEDTQLWSVLLAGWASGAIGNLMVAGVRARSKPEVSDA